MCTSPALIQKKIQSKFALFFVLLFIQCQCCFNCSFSLCCFIWSVRDLFHCFVSTNCVNVLPQNYLKSFTSAKDLTSTGPRLKSILLCLLSRVVHTTLVVSLEFFKPFFGYYFFNALLLVLQALHIFWAYLILRMVYKFMFMGKVRGLLNQPASEGEQGIRHFHSVFLFTP